MNEANPLGWYIEYCMEQHSFAMRGPAVYPPKFRLAPGHFTVYY